MQHLPIIPACVERSSSDSRTHKLSCPAQASNRFKASSLLLAQDFDKANIVVTASYLKALELKCHACRCQDYRAL